MIELPEAYVLAQQINDTLVGKTIAEAAANQSPHGFAFYAGDPAAYGGMLNGKTIVSSNPGTGYTCGGNVEIIADDMLLVLSTPIRYHAPGAKLPAKHQLRLSFTDGSALTCTVQMWGAMLCYPKDGGKAPDAYIIRSCPSPLEDAFDEAYFQTLMDDHTEKLSTKAFLATEQRIPGLGNGVLQDILWNARLHPKRKMHTVDKGQRRRLYQSVKQTLADMANNGGRDTERDLFGQNGGYQTILSKNNVGLACPACGGIIKREAYMGGNIYVCEHCQPLSL